MNYKARLILAIAVGLSIYFTFLASSQIDLATEAVNILYSCENSEIQSCISLPEYSRLTSRWDGNVKIYLLLSLLLSLVCGYFSHKFKKQ
ncbi:hypothetical protein GCM10008107_24360 [Psychrosphaera saromensis]|uniref:Uncharacterized protein n=1 Tax=Psychrosphaera saromensis TaxID=716813 RepID=A0A2S7UYK4_9GAMM|nr:hypothetical protein BTO11_12195 [Psychrosphaera saromensis]GHB74142.1 hypothetical protein GCM10008107_24360 [Psychrosphaera saromensis]GLQ12549.1 hypothetical protein GCM10007917_00040 [Psychrosphaera saromensis]